MKLWDYLYKLFTNLLTGLLEIIKDSKGNISSIRVIMFMVFFFVVFVYFDYREVLFIEADRDVPNYEGLAALYNAMFAGMITFITAVVGKIVQKTMER